MVSPSLALSTWAIDPDHSRVQFSLAYMGVGCFTARFRSFAGAIRANEEDPATGSVAVTIQVDSVDVTNQALADWLLSEACFNHAEHPQIAFRSTGLRHVDGSQWRVDGDLTIAGYTHPITLDMVYHGRVNHPFVGRPMAAFMAETTLRRGDFGIGWNTVLDGGAAALGERVRVTLEICAFLEV